MKALGFVTLFVLALALAPAAEACCTPCTWCDEGVPDSSYCCWGTATSGCTLMTCGEYRENYGSSALTDTAGLMGLLRSPSTPVTPAASSCDALPFDLDAAPAVAEVSPF